MLLGWLTAAPVLQHVRTASAAGAPVGADGPPAWIAPGRTQLLGLWILGPGMRAAHCHAAGVAHARTPAPCGCRPSCRSSTLSRCRAAPPQVEEGTPFARRYSPGEAPLPSDESAAAMYRQASRALTMAGACLRLCRWPGRSAGATAKAWSRAFETCSLPTWHHATHRVCPECMPGPGPVQYVARQLGPTFPSMPLCHCSPCPLACMPAAPLCAGFEHYEVSNFALPGHRCRHNMAYWEGRAFYGFGMGSASYLQASQGQGAGGPSKLGAATCPAGAPSPRLVPGPRPPHLRCTRPPPAPRPALLPCRAAASAGPSG